MGELFCQSCGMPLSVPEHYGTNLGGERNHDYCYFCYQDGRFTADLSMDEMIEFCTQFIDEWKLPDNRQITRDEAIALMKEQFPRLKRWAKRKETENEYRKAVNRAMEYIDAHLSEEIDLQKLADVAHVSPYHFHRIFFSVIGENIGEYVLRIRMEYAAGALLNSSLGLAGIADRTGYQTIQSLSKAFKKYFGVSPSQYRKRPNPWKKVLAPGQLNFQLQPEIREVSAANCVYVRIMDVYGAAKSYNMAWGRLYHFALDRQLITERTGYIGLSYDDPTITSPERCRFYACITVEQDVRPAGEFGVRKIKGGLYAVFTLKGSYNSLMDYYRYIYSEWLPASGYKLRNSFSFEKYLNNPEQVSESDLKTEIYIPVSRIEMKK